MNIFDDGGESRAKAVLERRNPLQPEQREIGRLISCSGGQAVVSIGVRQGTESAVLDYWSIGRLIAISMDRRRIIAVVYEMDTVMRGWSETEMNTVHFKVELVGEIMDNTSGRPVFTRGISSYPNIGAVAHKVRVADLAAIHVLTTGNSVEVGRLSQDHSIPATVDVGEMLAKHFAMVGTTGVGKTTAVSLLIRKAVETLPNLRVLILDPHNEYENALGEHSMSLGAETLELPFWLFTFEEFADVVFRGADAAEGEKSALMEVIVQAKMRFQSARSATGTTARRVSADEGANISVDAPVPYRMADLFSLILDLMGKLEAKYSRFDLRNLKSRLEGLCQNFRYRFMFRSTMIEDNIEKVLGAIFRIPHNDKRVTILQLADLPSDVTNSVVSVLGRLALDLCVIGQSSYQIAVICEEAHRYIPNDHRRGFGPTRQAIARIAKEGRKFGCSIGVVTQRPSEVDSTILSQCSTVFAMRLSNEADQNIIRSAISQSSEGRVSFLSSIRNRETIAFGEAIAMPMRFEFTQLPREQLGSAARETVIHNTGEIDLRSVVQRMRGQDETQRLMAEAAGVTGSSSAPPVLSATTPAFGNSSNAPLAQPYVPQQPSPQSYVPPAPQPAPAQSTGFGQSPRPASKFPAGW